jgi:hypothetical protein
LDPTPRIAKQFFAGAVKARIITANPFAELHGISVQSNKERFHSLAAGMPKRSWIRHDAKWRLLFALGRFGGLRSRPTPWLALGRCRPRSGQENSNLRSQLLRIMARAKVKPWPKIFQNLRSTRQTELAEEFPSHVVCGWMGNSRDVAREHYLQVTDQHFAKAAHKAAQSGAISNNHEQPQSEENAELTAAECSGGDKQWAVQDSKVSRIPRKKQYFPKRALHNPVQILSISSRGGLPATPISLSLSTAGRCFETRRKPKSWRSFPANAATLASELADCGFSKRNRNDESG